MPKMTQNTAKQTQNCAQDEDTDEQTDDWSSEEEEEDQPPAKSRRTSSVVLGPGQTGVSPGVHPASDTAGAGRTKGETNHAHGHGHSSGAAETHRSSGSKCTSTSQSYSRSARCSVGLESEGELLINVRGGESLVPLDVSEWGRREVRHLVYRRGDYTSDPCDVIAELTLDVTDAASATPDNNVIPSLPATTDSSQNCTSPVPPSPTSIISDILEFFKHVLRNLDGVKILGRTGVLPEDLCILSHLVGPDRYRHRRRLEAMVDMCPESENVSCKPEEGGTGDISMGVNRLEDRRRLAAAEIMHTNTFSIQQRLLLAARQVWYGENLTTYLADKMLNGILGALSVLVRTCGVRRNFVVDNNPSMMTLVGEGGPDKILHTGTPSLMIYTRTETIQEPELFCVVQVKKKCTTVNSSITKPDGKMVKKTKAGCADSASRNPQRIRWHEVGDNSIKKRLADTTFSQAGGELLGHLLLTYTNNTRSCFMDNKYLGLIIHGTKVQLVVAKMKNADSCVDSIKHGGAKPTKKLCVLYSPNMDYFIPEQRQQLLHVLVNLVL